jgi:hypothetical protein
LLLPSSGQKQETGPIAFRSSGKIEKAAYRQTVSPS